MRQSVGRYLDSLPVNRFHKKAFWLIAAGLLFDGFDIYLAGGVLAALVKEGWTTPETMGSFVTLTFVGMTIGALLAGWTGDKFGRGMMYQFNLLVFGIASIAAAFTTSFVQLEICRCIQGVGLGAEIVLGYATFGELMPPSFRGKWQSLLALFTNGALFVSAVCAAYLIPAFSWRIMFILVGIPALLVWWLRRALPESPRWLVSKGRTDEALSVLKHISGKNDLQLELKEEHNPKNQGKWGDLFKGTMAVRTIFAMFLLAVLNIGVYGFNSWLPSILVKNGLDIAKSLEMTMIISAGAIVGALITAAFADKFSSKFYISITSLLTALSGILYTNMTSNTGLIVAGFLFQTFLYCVVVMVWAVYIPMLFPTNIRLRGTGLANAVGRFATIVMPYIFISPLLGSFGFKGVIGALAGVYILTAILSLIIGTDIQGKSLETLNEAHDEAVTEGQTVDA